MIEVAGVVARLGFKVDDDGARKFEARLGRAREDAKKGATAHLQGELDPKAFSAYERKLKETQSTVARREKFRAKLGADFDPRAFNAAERELKRTQRAQEDNVKSVGRLRTAWGTVYGRGGAAVLAAGGIYGIGAALGSVVRASGESEASQRRMQAQLRASGISYREHAKDIDRVIQRTSRLAGIDDEDLQDAFTNIVRATGSVKTGLRDVGLVADIVAAKHISAARAGDLLAKAESGNVGALRRFGVVVKPVTAAQDELAKSHDKVTAAQRRQAVELDKQATAQKSIAAAQQRFAGQAVAAGNTQQGAINRLGVAWENLQETIGGKLAPILTKAANGLAKFVNQMQDGTGAGGKFVDILSGIWDRAKAVGRAIGDLIGWFHRHKTATDALLISLGALTAGFAAFKIINTVVGIFKALRLAWIGVTIAMEANPFVLIISALVALGAGLVIAYKRSATFRKIVSEALHWVAQAGKDALDGILGFVTGFLGGISSMLHVAEHIPIVGKKFRGWADDIDAARRKLDGFRQSLRDHKKAQDDSSNAINDSLPKLARLRQRYEDARDRQNHLTKGTDAYHAAVLKTKAASDDYNTALKDTAQKAGGAKQPVKTLTRNIDGLGGVSHDTAVAVAKNLNSVLSQVGAKTIKLNTQAYRHSGINQMTDVTGHAATGGVLDRRHGLRKHLWSGGIPHPGSGSADDHILVDPYGQPVAAMSGTEGILNRPQMMRVNAWGGIVKSLGLDTIGSLNELWSSGMRHYASGGALQPAVASLSNRLDQMFGLVTTSTTGGGHAPGSYHYRGLAADISGSGDAMSRASRYIMSSGIFRSLLEGIHNPGLSVKNGRVVAPGFWGASTWAQHMNHIHLALQSLGGAGAINHIRVPKITGPAGAILTIGRAGARRMTTAANRYLDRVLSTIGGGDTTHVAAAGADANVVSAFRRASSALRANPTERLALFEAGIVESGLRNLHHGDADSLGALQERTSIYGRGHALNPYASASRFLRDAEGLRPWRGSAGMLAAAVQRPRADLRGRYDQVAAQARQYLGRGGQLLRRFQGGGLLGGGFPSGPFTTPLEAQIVGGRQVGRLRKVRGRQVAAFNAIEGDRGTLAYLHKDYDLAQRHFDAIDITPDDQGNVNMKAVAEKAKWAQRMYTIDAQIRDQTVKARTIAARVAASYRAIVARWQAVLRYSRGTSRAAIRQNLKGAQAGVRAWSGTLRDLGYDVANARLDASDAFNQWQAVLGTKPTSTAAGGGGSSGGLTPDQQALLDQATTLKQIVAQGTFLNTAAQGVLGGVTAPGAVFNPNVVGQAGFGGAATPAGGDVHIHFESFFPPTPQQAQQAAGHVVAGLGYQPSVRSARVSLGV